MNRLTIYPLFSLITALLLLAGCADPTNPFFRAPDFSSVPPLADTTGVEPIVHDGYLYYVIEEGEGEFSLQVRPNEQLEMFLTLRTADGEILQSTRADERDWPEGASMDDLSEPDGLREGVRGMKEKEHRVIVVYPPMGFQDVSRNSQFYTFRNDTLIYEIEVESIR